MKSMNIVQLAFVFKGFTNHVTCNITCSFFFFYYMQMQNIQHPLYNDLNFELKFVILPYSNCLHQCSSDWANGHPWGHRTVTENYMATLTSEQATENSLHE